MDKVKTNKIKDNTSLTSLKDIISLLRERGLPFDSNNEQLCKTWKNVVGEQVSQHTRPVWIKNRLLMVEVSSPIWIQELRYREEEIKRRFNDMLGRDAIKKIRFKVG